MPSVVRRLSSFAGHGAGGLGSRITVNGERITLCMDI